MIKSDTKYNPERIKWELELYSAFCKHSTEWLINSDLFGILQRRQSNLHGDPNSFWHEVLGIETRRSQRLGRQVSNCISLRILHAFPISFSFPTRRHLRVGLCLSQCSTVFLGNMECYSLQLCSLTLKQAVSYYINSAVAEDWISWCRSVVNTVLRNW